MIKHKFRERGKALCGAEAADSDPRGKPCMACAQVIHKGWKSFDARKPVEPPAKPVPIGRDGIVCYLSVNGKEVMGRNGKPGFTSIRTAKDAAVNVGPNLKYRIELKAGGDPITGVTWGGLRAGDVALGARGGRPAPLGGWVRLADPDDMELRHAKAEEEYRERQMVEKLDKPTVRSSHGVHWATKKKRKA